MNLRNPLGTIYTRHNQTGVLNIIDTNGTPGGYAIVDIVANGSAINVPAGWIKYGGDDISFVNGAINHFQVFYKSADVIYCTNKVQ